MRNKIYAFIVGGLMVLSTHQNVTAQCATSSFLSSAVNMYGVIDNRNTPVAVDKDLNTIAFVHRHSTALFGGNTGNLRYDVSTNGGNSWSTNNGVLNPLSTSYARYPNGFIYNPAANTNTANAYVGYFAPTVNPSNSFFNGVVNGVRQLSGSGNTEIYNQPNVTPNFKPLSVVKGAPGVFWALDMSAVNNGASYTGNIYVYKGTWGSSSNTVVWTLNTTLAPPTNPNAGFSPFGDISIGFDPSGTVGWISVITDISTSSTNFAFAPVFYKTTNGGTTWSSPISVNLNTIACINSNMTFGALPGLDSQGNLAVDLLGNPHLMAVVGENTGYEIDPSAWRCIMDITYTGTAWTAYDVSAVNGDLFSIVGPISTVQQDYSLQTSRSADGKKIFFSWTDNSSYSQGSVNSAPNLFSRGLDVQQLKWTPIKDFTSCNIATAGKIFFPHVAREVIEPTTTSYKLAPVYGEFTVNSDPDSPVNYLFLDNCLFAASEFTTPLTTTLNLSVLPGPTGILCPGSYLTMQLTGAYSFVQWSTGSGSNFTQVNTPGTYSVTAKSGCSTGSTTIVVKTLTMSVGSSSTGICQGSTVNLSVNGNAYGYTWTPGGLTGSNIAVSPSLSTTYIVSAAGDGCYSTSSVNINVTPSPTILAVSNHTLVCAGEEVVIQALGPTIYVWSTGATTPSISVFPTANTTYTVTGYNAQGCSTSYQITQLVNPCTGISGLNKDASFLEAYPNPSNGSFVLRSSRSVNLSLFNGFGQLIRTVALNADNNYSANIEALPSGIYFAGGENLPPKKIIVSR